MATGTHLPAPSLAARVQVAKTHLTDSVKWKGELVGVRETRKHYSNYFRGLPHFKPTRIKLVTEDSYEEVMATLDTITESFGQEAAVAE